MKNTDSYSSSLELGYAKSDMRKLADLIVSAYCVYLQVCFFAFFRSVYGRQHGHFMKLLRGNRASIPLKIHIALTYLSLPCSLFFTLDILQMMHHGLSFSAPNVTFISALLWEVSLICTIFLVPSTENYSCPASIRGPTFGSIEIVHGFMAMFLQALGMCCHNKLWFYALHLGVCALYGMNSALYFNQDGFVAKTISDFVFSISTRSSKAKSNLVLLLESEKSFGIRTVNFAFCILAVTSAVGGMIRGPCKMGEDPITATFITGLTYLSIFQAVGIFFYIQGDRTLWLMHFMFGTPLVAVYLVTVVVEGPFWANFQKALFGCEFF